MYPTRTREYRKDIDGLRGIAVLLVVLYHLGAGFVPAGFVGVDIFFVISGFLITSRIMHDIQQGQFSLQDFYMRRIRRILPVLVFVLVCATSVAYIVLLPIDLKRYCQSLMAALLSISNIYFWKFIRVGYFGTDSSVLPLLHTWSLGIEEQFYVVWAFVLIIFSKGFIRTKGLYVTLLLGMLSFALYIFLSFYKYTAFAYYSPFTRFFELWLGALLAICYAQQKNAHSPLLAMASLLTGLALIVFSACLLTASDYPGIYTVLPCLGAALLLFFGKSQHRLKSMMLENRSLVFIGIISYSLYLWHWPMIAYCHYFNLSFDFVMSITVLMASISLAYMSYRFIEQPCRYRYLFGFSKSIIVYVIIPIMCAIVFYAFLRYEEYRGFNTIDPIKMIDSSTYYGVLKKELGCHRLSKSSASSALPLRSQCVIGDLSPLNPAVLVVGDSHAMAAVDMLHYFLLDQQLKGYVVTQSSAPFLVGNILDWNDDSPMERNHFIAEEIKQRHYRFVVMGGYWNNYADLRIQAATKHIPFFALEQGLRNAVKLILEAHSIPVIVIDTPPLINVPTVCGFARLFSQHCYNAKQTIDAIQLTTRQMIASIKKEFPTTILIDPANIMCDQAKCYSQIDNIPLYSSGRENSHLSAVGSSFIGRAYVKKYGNPFATIIVSS